MRQGTRLSARMEGNMIKWLLNKSLRFQIVFVIALVISVPTAVTIWNVVIPSKEINTLRGMQEERLKNIFGYLDEALNKEDIYNLKNDNEKLHRFEEDLKAKAVPISRSMRDTWVGIYLPVNDRNYVFANFFDEKGFPHVKSLQVETAEGDLKEDINEVIKTREEKINYLEYKNREKIRYIHPIVLNDEVIAVMWDEALLPPDNFSRKKTLGYITLFGLLGLILGLIMMIIIVRNLNRNIIKIRNGLEKMSVDFSYRIENLGGDIGKIAKDINHMGEALKERELLKEQLIRADKLASLGQLIAGVAHEIRNPLGIIRGTVQLMERDFKDVKGIEEYIRIVKEQSDRENRVIQELLDYARPSRQVLSKMDMNVLIRSILSFTNKYLQDSHIKLQLSLEEDLPEIIMDCDKIKQVFVNIVINACEAMEGGGTLCIKTERADNFIKIYFKDTGVGMDELQIKNLFNPYYTTKPRGTGLGLAISNGIVEIHGGNIQVNSKKGQGSTFIVSLPINKDEQQ